MSGKQRRGLAGGPSNPVKAYTRAKALVERRFALVIHMAVYAPINAILWWLDLGLSRPGDPRWAYAVSWAWGIGLACHFVAVFVLADTRPRTPLAETLRERRIAFYLHFFAYVNAVIFFWVVNLFGPQIITELGGGIFDTWAAWPTLFWGLAIFYHWFFTFVVRGWRVKKWKQRWTLRVMEQLPDRQEPGPRP